MVLHMQWCVLGDDLFTLLCRSAEAAGVLRQSAVLSTARASIAADATTSNSPKSYLTRLISTFVLKNVKKRLDLIRI